MMKMKMDEAIKKRKPVTDELYLSKDFVLEDYLDNEGGMYIEPTKGMVLKMWTMQGEKVFINLVAHSIIDEPEQKYLIDYEQEGIRIPMSVGKEKEDFDKSKEPCKVIDCVLAPKILKNIQDDKDQLTMVC
jgi:hypothetical protein